MISYFTQISLSKLKWIFRIIAILLAFVRIYNQRCLSWGDAIGYLDITDNFLQNGLYELANGYWSPLLPLLLAIIKPLISISGYYELIIIKFFNLLILIFTLACFEIFLNQLIKFNQWVSTLNPEKLHPIPDWNIIIISYSIFIWSYIPAVYVVSPDVLLPAWIYLAYFLLLKIQMNNKNKIMFAYLGIILGLAFLTKPFANIFIIFFLLFIFFTNKDFKQTIIHIGIVLVTLLILIGPYILALSNYKGHFTLGEAVKLNYAIRVNKVKGLVHWQGECNPKITNCQKIGKPIHPTIKIYNNPDTYAFDNIFNATLPTWYDPSYWYDGVTPYFNLKEHLKAYKTHKDRPKHLLLNIFDEKRSYGGGVFIPISFLFLTYLSRRGRLYLADLKHYLQLLIPSTFILIIIIFIYSTVRYLLDFITLFYLPLFFAIRFPGPIDRNLIKKINVATFLVLLIVITNGFTLIKTFTQEIKHKPDYPHIEVAKYLNEMGIKKGDKVARLDNTLKPDWARLAKVMIIAEVDSSLPRDRSRAKEGHYRGKFWKVNKEKQAKILKAFKDIGAQVVVSETVPSYASYSYEEWQRVNDTRFYLYDLRREK